MSKSYDRIVGIASWASRTEVSITRERPEKVVPGFVTEPRLYRPTVSSARRINKVVNNNVIERTILTLTHTMMIVSFLFKAEPKEPVAIYVPEKSHVKH